MSMLQGLDYLSTELNKERAIPIDVKVVLWSAVGLVMTALFLAFGFQLDVGQALMLAG